MPTTRVANFFTVKILQELQILEVREMFLWQGIISARCKVLSSSFLIQNVTSDVRGIPLCKEIVSHK